MSKLSHDGLPESAPAFCRSCLWRQKFRRQRVANEKLLETLREMKRERGRLRDRIDKLNGALTAATNGRGRKCRKRRHTDRTSAQLHVEYMERRYGEPFEPYICRKCADGSWHIGHVPSGKEKA